MLFINSFIYLSCKTEINIHEEIDLSTGAFIVNEGNFMSNNGEISFYNTATGEITNNLYARQNNNLVLGDVVQSFCITDSYGLIAVNNSQKVVVVELNNFKHYYTFQGIYYPRYIIPVRHDICYLSNGKSPGKVFVLDLLNKKIIDTLNVGNEPENMLLFNNKVYVTNGAWGHDSTLTIINAVNDDVISTLTIGDGACDLVVDNLDRIWVLCQGKTLYDFSSETPSTLVCFNPVNNEIIMQIPIGVRNDYFYPVRLTLNPQKTILYYIEHNGVYKMSIDDPYNHQLIIPGVFYSLEVNPADGNLYLFSDNAFNGPGTLSVYTPSATPVHLNIKTGIGPNAAVFK